MPKCYMLVGVPASGKSTFSYDNFDLGTIISTDAIIDYISHTYGMTYNESFKDLIGFAEKVMWKNINSCIERGLDIIIDRTNLTEKSRKKFIDKLKPFGYTFQAIVFPEVGSAALSEEEWKRRLANRPGKTIPDHILESMVDNYEIPLMSEGFEKTIFVE